MIDANHRVGKSSGEVDEIVEMLDTRVDARDQIVSSQMFETGAPRSVHKVASVAKISDTTNVGVVHVTLKHLCSVGIGEMTFGDDAVRVTGLVGESLNPLRLVSGVWNAQRRLDVDRLRHVREADFGDIVFDPIMLRFDCVYVAQEAMDRIRL